MSHLSPEEGNIPFLKCCFTKFWMVDKVCKPSDSECYAPLSEPFRLVLTFHIRNMISEMLKSPVRFVAMLSLVPDFDRYSHLVNRVQIINLHCYAMNHII
jgi:hypothetical protein